MQLADLVDIQLISGSQVGMKTSDEVVKLTFRNRGKEEEIVLFPPLFCHAIDLEDNGLPEKMKNKEQLLDNARSNERLATVLQRFFTPSKERNFENKN